MKKGSAGAVGAPLVLVVYSKAISDEIGIETLVGEYTESGANHGKKVFKRTKIPTGVEDIPVFMYYWDARDGADFSGWWFGESVGGSQVWSRCDKADALPPTIGWRIPWDGEVQADLVVDRKARAAAAAAQEAKAEKHEEPNDATPGTEAEAAERVQRAEDRVQIVETEAGQALESAKVMVEGEVTEDNLKVVDELLHAQLQVLNEANKVLAGDIMDARKTAPKAVMRLTKLAPRVRTVQASLAQEIKAGKQLAAKKKQEAEDAKKRVAAEEKLMIAEQHDAKALEDALPEAMEAAAQAEELLDTVIAAASPLASEEEANAITSAAIKETEAAVVKAMIGLKQARTHINQKIAAAKQYAPEARKVALTEFSTLQDKLNDIQKKISPYSRIRKELEHRLEGKKVMAEVAQKMGEAELEVEKVVNVLSGTKPSEDEIKAAEANVSPAMTTLTGAIQCVEEKLKSAHSSLKEELVLMQKRGMECKKQLSEFSKQLRGRMEGLQLQIIMREAGDKTKTAEEALAKTAEAEAPFVKGMDFLPQEEASEAVAASKKAGEAAEAIVAEAKAFLKAKIVVVKCYPESVHGSSIEDISLLMARVEDASQRLAAFQKETAVREAASMLHEVTQKVVDAEAKVQKTIEAAEPLLADQTEVEVERIKVATQLTLDAEKTAALACADTRKVLMTKLKEGKARDTPSYSAELTKLQSRLTFAQQELQRQRKVALQGEKLWKAKLVVQEKTEDLKLIEEEVEQAEILTTPLGDERPSDEKITEMVNAVDSIQAKLVAAMTSLESVQSSVQGSAKTQLNGLIERVKASQVRVDEMKETTREQRERVACESILREAQAKLNAVDEAFGKTSDAEAPYLKGIEFLPLEETIKAVADSEVAIVGVQEAIDEARAFLQEKVVEIRKFAEVVSKVGLKELDTLNKKRDGAVQKVALFTKETEERKRAMLQQQAVSKVTEAEAAARKMMTTAKDFTLKETESGEVEITPKAAQEMCDRFAAASKFAEERLDDARQYMVERQRATRAEKKDQATVQEMSGLVSRLNTVQSELGKAKSIASEHEQKFVAKMVMQEASDLMRTLESGIEKVTEEAAPLLVEGGRRFVVASMIKMIAEALSEHAVQHGLSHEDVFGQIDSGAAAEGKVAEFALLAFLERVPELCSRKDLAFSQEQRKAICAQLDNDGDGMVTKSEFLGLFLDSFVCIHSISMTDGYDIGTSKNIDKLDVDDVVETLAEPVTDEMKGMTRVEVRKLKDGTRGWVTMQGNHGKLYLSLYTTYTDFNKGFEKVISTAKIDAAKATEYINAKSKELSRCEKGPLVEARAELSKLRPKVSVLSTKLDTLRMRIDECKRDHNKREDFERRKAEDKKDRKAAALILKAIREKVEAAEASVKALEEVAAPLTSDDISGVADPIAVREGAEKAAGDLEAPIADAKACLSAHEGKVAKAAKGAWFDAKKDMKLMNQRIVVTANKVTEIIQAVQAGCEALAEAKIGQVAAALRHSIQTGGSSTEELFAKLSDSEDRISEAALSRHLETLPNLSLSVAHRRLLFQAANAGGVSRRSFFDMVERYYKCVKDIAITTGFDIKSSSTLRKLEVDEFVEVLEGPQSDTTLGVMRIRARALSDGKAGWVTATGNHGTPFLQEMPRPCLYAAAPVSLQDGFVGEDSSEVRAVKANEVLELLEGPRKEVVGTAMRAKGKALSDGVVGWFTVKSKHGIDHVQPGKSTYTCMSSIALTDSIDIKNCKVVRKLSKGEGLTVLEGPVEDEKTSVPRIRAKAALDGAEGWVTVRGNAGSVYAEETGRQMVVCRAMTMHADFASDSKTVRSLADEEVLEILEGPEEEASEAPVRARVRALHDGKVGWVTVQDRNLLPWSPNYRCVAATPMHDAHAVESAMVLRRLDVGEEVELLQGPRVEEGLGVMRFRGRAAKDGLIGWVTIAGNAGKPFLKCIPPE